ncbi:MAG TPA: hypothetical protein PLS07_15030 [Niabella sp.]|nr:hypothetical protein [Niabella sp.]HQX21317.1 hypothetical protein [Niabella sp.]HQX41900.1 hypothetical protein [Niabella sp.]HRB08091.1 hypothetical protein [Niabella sp.]HRB28478.1 hypothetical protein [Niabella sp.]
MRALIFLSYFLVLFSCTKTKTEKPNPQENKPGILWGSSAGSLSGESKEQAYQRVKAAFGKHEIVRLYNAGDPVWPDWLSKETVAHISFKMDPKEVLNGSKDAVLNQFFSGLSSTAKQFWTYYHEPEDQIRDGEFTAAEYRSAFDYIIALQAKFNKPNLVPTLCLMAYSLDPISGRNWKDYLPTKVALISWDGYYNDNMGEDASSIFNPVRVAMKQTNLPWAVAETGVNKNKKSGKVDMPLDEELRKRVLTALAKDLSSQLPLPVFVEYFDSAPPQDNEFSDWRISTNLALVSAWNSGQIK